MYIQVVAISLIMVSYSRCGTFSLVIACIPCKDLIAIQVLLQVCSSLITSLLQVVMMVLLNYGILKLVNLYGILWYWKAKEMVSSKTYKCMTRWLYILLYHEKQVVLRIFLHLPHRSPGSSKGLRFCYQCIKLFLLLQTPSHQGPGKRQAC